MLNQIRAWCWRLRWFLGIIGAVAFLAMAAWLRHLPFSSEPILYSYLQIVGSLLCFTYAANALVRFRGTHDRLTLILAFGFVLSGAIETAATFNFYDILASGALSQMHVPLAWMVSRTLLALVLIAALIVERRVPNSRDPGREIAVSLRRRRRRGVYDQCGLFRVSPGTEHAPAGPSFPGPGISCRRFCSELPQLDLAADRGTVPPRATAHFAWRCG